ncbi:uncharacterized protein LOC109706655 isoform X2 [Ananas comosus]|uniref:Uncharacterized protein LOC109706655 isoform X2 n=1 Tax=Ananas comosus TaxID=4615 RepID=A0A6P5EID0_ANACO|nr:uncharacterized protein LOC109706655 isoform X2 [Ananas comosus]
MGEYSLPRQGRAAKKTSWRRTVATQAALCLALYGAFAVGRLQKPPGHGRRETLDLHFLSVAGLPRHPQLQTQLLLQAAKIFKAKFVLNIGELEEDDPFWHNATMYFRFLRIPWYTITVSQRQRYGNFVKRIALPHEQVLELIGIDTGSLQGFMHADNQSKISNEQVQWLQETLELSDSNWRIVVGFDPLMICDEEHTTERAKFYEPLHSLFIRHGVNAYLSTRGCVGYFYHDGTIMHIGNPTPSDKRRGAFLANKNVNNTSEVSNGFLVHRVTPLEIGSYLIDSEGRVALKSVVQQNGRGVM